MSPAELLTCISVLFFLLVSDGPLSLRHCPFCSSCSHALSLEHICQILLCSSCCFLLRSSAYTFFPVLGVFQLNEFAYTSVPTTVLPTSELSRVQAPFIIFPPNYNALFSSSVSSCPLVGLGLGWIPLALGAGITLDQFFAKFGQVCHTA